MDDLQAREWEAAQALSISVDLVASARQELELLANVNRNPCLYGGPAVTRAIERYKICWLPLLAGEGKDPHKWGFSFVPPLDCAWIWHCHRLNPVQYSKDCKTLFGRLLDAPLIHPADKQAATDATIYLWSSQFQDEPYNIDLSQFPCLTEENKSAENDFEENDERDESVAAVDCITPLEETTATVYDLADAVSRQKSFYYQVSRPYTTQMSFLKAAEQRYKGFLHLFTKAGEKTFLVPTYDIDIMWHAHQLCPAAYSRDTLAIVARVLEHDDAVGDRSTGHKLDTGFNDTCELWEKTFGTIYIRAGGMYRGDLPGVIPPPNATTLGLMHSDVISMEQKQQQTYLSRRQTVQVCLVLMGARNVPTKSTGRTLFIRLKALHKCSAFKMDTHQVPTSSDPEWKQMLMLHFETSTEGIVLELLSSPTGILKYLRDSKLIGEATLTWHTLLASASLSVMSWLPLSSQKLSYHSKSMEPPALQVASSITPPIVAPYLCRTVKAPATDDHRRTLFKKGHHEGRWITRTVLDHADKEIFVVRIKYAQGKHRPLPLPEDQRKIFVHQGAWKTHTFYNYKEAPERVAAQAKPMMELQAEREKTPHARRWALYNDAARLTVQIKAGDHAWDLKPDLDLQGRLGFPKLVLFLSIDADEAGETGGSPAASHHHIKLVSVVQLRRTCAEIRLVAGRKLEYEVKGSSDAEEAGFVTLVRYTPDAPLGKATALFNWRSAAMEVAAEETVALVVLLSTIVALSIFDMLGVRHTHIQRRKTRMKTRRPHGNEWGAVVLEKAPMSRRSMTRKLANYNMLHYYSWWEIPSLLWSSSFYCNPDLLKDDGSSDGDGHPLGGGCGAGACGAGECGAGDCLAGSGVCGVGDSGGYYNRMDEYSSRGGVCAGEGVWSGGGGDGCGGDGVDTKFLQCTY